MAENGILDYQGMNQAIYRGATSNIVVDTQSMSIEIGAGNSSHTSNLHIECDHDANVASIQLNSNVVTEFPRSKKLIKYPRVVLPRSAVGSTYNDYRIDRSSEHVTGSYLGVQELFNNTATDGNDTWGAGWDGSSGSYSTSTGEHSIYVSGGTTYGTAARLASNVPNGEWVSLQLPNAIQLNHVKIRSRNNTDWYIQYPTDFEFWGSNDNGTTWSHIKSFSNKAATAQATFSTFQVDSTKVYSRIALVVTKIPGTASTVVVSTGHAHFSISELHLYGTPEYDPEAHGTDVTVKSYPNVPNTDWLEVYYDAKNYTSGAVQDETTNDRDGVLYGDTSLTSADGIHKFDFDGNGDYIKTTLTGFTGTTVTFSAWVFMDSIAAGRANTIMGLGNWGSTGSAAWIAVGTGGFLQTGSISIGSCVSPVQASTLPKQWLHITGIVSSGDFRLYQDGQLIKSTNTTGAINYGNNPVLYLATRANSSGDPESTRYFDCKIANARLFNRALTSDEVWQLYAYQKEYFGHGDLSMTLKAGRLGIGTSEPRAMLDVRGMLNISDKIESPFFKVFSIFDKMIPTVNNSNWSRSIEGTIYAGSSVIVVANVGGYRGTQGGGNTWNIQYKIAGTTTWITLSDIYAYLNQTGTHLYRTRTFVWKPTEDIHFIEWRITTTLDCNADDKVDLVLVSLPV